MLERYFVMPGTIDRIRASWIASSVEQYVTWLAERGFSARTVCRRVPIVLRFGEFARERGAMSLAELPLHVDAFVSRWLEDRASGKSEARRRSLTKEIRGPIEQMLGIVVADFDGRGRPRQPENPLGDQAPGFFDYLRMERGLKETSIRHYSHHLRQFSSYLRKIEVVRLEHLSPPVLSGFVSVPGNGNNVHSAFNRMSVGLLACDPDRNGI